MNDKELDPSLQAPQEANTTKHINFLAIEEGDAVDTNNETDNDDRDGDESPTKKAWEELRKENKRKADSQE